MITGFNNDIKHRGSVFHVQTEDKGKASAWIESLIYVGGRILARKRVTYKQLLEEGGDRPAIAKLMKRQHSLMVEQIREGRFDVESSDGVDETESRSPREDGEIHTTRMRQQAVAMFGETGDPEVQAAVASQPAAPESASAGAEEADAAPEGAPPTLDQVIFDYLSRVAQEESLVLLMDESPPLASDTTTKMDLGTHASRSGHPIAEALVAVRMISKIVGPVTLAEGVTDEDGTLQLVVQVPPVPEDSAALIITATSSIGSAEIKHLL